MNWPAAALRREWETFYHDVDQVLESAISGDVGKKLKAMPSVIWSIGADRFGKKDLKG